MLGVEADAFEVYLVNARHVKNVPLHHVISDITGQTGLAIVDAILAGERDPLVLAKLRSERIKASEEVIAKSLVGDYRPEHLFTLRQSLAAYRHYQRLIDDCDREIRRSLEQFQPPRPSGAADGGSHKPQPKTPSREGILRSELKRAATALRMAAQSLHHSKSALGDFYRRMRAKLGTPKAITAAACAHNFGSRLESVAIHCAALRICRLSLLYFRKAQRAGVRSSCFIAGYSAER